MKFLAQIKDRWENELTLKVPGYLRSLLKTLDPNKEYLVSIEEKGKHRTDNQNRLMWKLLREIANRQYSRTPHDLYVQALVETGAQVDYLSCTYDIEARLKENFRFVRFLGKQDDRYMYEVYSGSSKFNTREMSQLIEVVLQYAVNVGLDDVETWRELFEL